MSSPESHAPDPPFLSLLLCDAHRANHMRGEGRQIVADGRLTTVDQDEVVALAREVIRAR